MPDGVLVPVVLLPLGYRQLIVKLVVSLESVAPAQAADACLQARSRKKLRTT